MSVTYQFKKDFNEHDPAKKTEAWASRLVSEFRRSGVMEPLYDPAKARINRSYLLGEQSMEKHKKKFAKPDLMPFEWRPLGIFEKMRNILTAEREKAGIFIQLNAMDPTAQEEKDYDRKLLENAPFIEEMLSSAQMAIGMPAYQLSRDKTLKGDKIAKGNLDTFKEVGLEAGSPEDIGYFFKTHYRIDTEIEAEDAVNHFVRVNELQEYLKEWLDDAIALKAIAGRVFTNEVTFTPDYEYLRPEDVRWIKGQRRDGKDARAIMSSKDMTVAECLGKIGRELNSELLRQLLDSVNFVHATHYDGLAFSDGTVTVECTQPCSYDAFLNMKIPLGYVEWKSINVDTQKVGRNTLGNYKVWAMPYEWEPSEKNAGNYKKETLWNVTTYKAYFIMRTATDQVIFKFGPLFDQQTYGPEDEYSSFSFQVYKQPGLSAIDVSIPYIDNIHDAWFRFNWILNKAKPKGTRYNYNVIAKIASKMYKEDKEESGVMRVIKMFQESIDDFYVNDSLNPNVGGGQNPHFDKPNGLDESVKQIYQVITDQQEQLSDKLGINAIREAYSPSPNDGYKLQMQSLAQSRNATEYISRMIMSVLVNYAKHTLTIVQDLIEFKGQKGYKVLERALGITAIDRLKALKRAPLHKFGIFVESFNTDLERKQQQDEATQAWQKGEISYHVYMLIRSIDNYKKASEVLAYEKAKENKRKAAEQEAAHQQAMEQAAQLHEQKLQLVSAEYTGKMGVQQEQNKGLIEVANINNQADYLIKKQSLDAEGNKADVRAAAKIREKEADERMRRGVPMETEDL